MSSLMLRLYRAVARAAGWRGHDSGCGRVAGLLMAVGGLLLSAEGAVALVVEYPTADPARMLRLVITGNPGGLALDAAGNIYFTDQGDGTPGNGSIRMIPKATMVPMTLFSGLDRPGDLELTPDGRALVFASGDNRISLLHFGLSVNFRSTSGYTVEGLTLYVDRPGLGITKGYRQMTDGFYAIPDILVPGMTATQVDLIVEFPTGKTFRYAVDLGQIGHDTPFGQTVRFFVVAD